MLKPLLLRFNHYIWHTKGVDSILQARLIQFFRIMSLVVKDLLGGMLSLRAMSLVYTTLLSLVPLIAVSFAMLKGFGAHNQVEPMLANLLTPLGDKGPEITAQIIEFVDNMKMGVLGSVGMVMLIYTVVSLIYKIETAFNFTWHISTSRTPVQRFSNYLSIVIVGPLMMFAAIGMTASLASNTVVGALNEYEAVGQIVKYIGYTLPYIMIIAVFTFIYLLVPNISVKFKSALYGAFFSGIIWELLSRSFASFASGSTSYTAIYSGFAILILFMIWLYLGWLVLLTGANIAYYHQYPERLQWAIKQRNLTGQLREQVTLQIMVLLARQHVRQISGPISESFLAEQLVIPSEVVQDLTHCLMKTGFIKKSDDDPAQYLIAKSLELISVAELIACAQQNADETYKADFIDPLVEKLMNQHQLCIQQKFSSINLASIIKSS